MPPHKSWTTEQRIAVHLLFSQYDLDNNSKVAIFNRIFRDYLREQGLNGLNLHKLDVQYRERTRPHRAQQWQIIIRDPTNAAEQAFRDAHVQSIETTATALGISPGKEV